jgi:hypothetical protein
MNPHEKIPGSKAGRIYSFCSSNGTRHVSLLTNQVRRKIWRYQSVSTSRKSKTIDNNTANRKFVLQSTTQKTGCVSSTCSTNGTHWVTVNRHEYHMVWASYWTSVNGNKCNSNEVFLNISDLWLDNAVIFTVSIPRLKYHEIYF